MKISIGQPSLLAGTRQVSPRLVKQNSAERSVTIPMNLTSHPAVHACGNELTSLIKQSAHTGLRRTVSQEDLCVTSCLYRARVVLARTDVAVSAVTSK